MDRGLNAERGASILKDTIAEMTFEEVAEALGRGAIALWGCGVVEQHGPHLPTGTDIYIPSARLRLVRRMLAVQGIEALIIPPFYWGVNHVSASFPASIKVRPEVMIALMVDVMKSLADDGLRVLYCTSGHNDRAHNAAIFEAVQQGTAASALQAAFLSEAAMIDRLGVPPDHPNVLPFHPVPPETPPEFLDIHAGEWETSIMLAMNPETVKDSVIASLASTRLGPEDLAIWRNGHEDARRVTPLGYFGDPAAASAERGRAMLSAEAEAIVQAIAARHAG